jgi:hypothetical protein
MPVLGGIMLLYMFASFSEASPENEFTFARTFLG